MTRDRTGDRQWLRRRSYAALAAAWAFFIAYGSFVPFEFQPQSFSEALIRFRDALSLPFYLDSRTDFVTNVLIAVPLGYLALAALLTDSRSRWRRPPALLLTVAGCMVLSTAIEFTQVFFRGRTDSLSDITAQSVGAVVGVALWLLVGEAITAWLRDSLRERERPALLQRILLAYCVMFVVSQIMPLDLTMNLGELARKYRNGQILIRPFAYPYDSRFDMLWDYAGDILLNIPIGAAAVLLWTRDRTRRGTWAAIALATAAVASIEFAQVFVNSRIADVTDVLTGSIGAAFGVFLATKLSTREIAASAPHDRAVVSRYARLGVVLWILVLMSYHWRPFDFTMAPDRVVEGMRQFLSVPFSSYYLGTEFHALTEMLRKFLLALPLGVFLRLSIKRDASVDRRRLRMFATALIGFFVLVVIEFGQVFLPARVPDLTDAFIGEIGIVLGAALTARLTMLQSPLGLLDQQPSRVPPHYSERL
jgi:glycopeptide antibiotics resistance protein